MCIADAVGSMSLNTSPAIRFSRFDDVFARLFLLSVQGKLDKGFSNNHSIMPIANSLHAIFVHGIVEDTARMSPFKHLCHNFIRELRVTLDCDQSAFGVHALVDAQRRVCEVLYFGGNIIDDVSVHLM